MIAEKLDALETLDAIGREYGFFLFAVHRCKDGWGAQWRQGDEDSLPYSYFNVYPTITEMVKSETGRIKFLIASEGSTLIPAYPV